MSALRHLTWGRPARAGAPGYCGLVTLALLAACGGATAPVTVNGPLPNLVALSVAEAEFGDQVGVHGYHFGDAQRDGRVLIGDIEAPVVSWSDAQIHISVPSGLEPGRNLVAVITAPGRSGDSILKVRPTLHRITESHGGESEITLAGENFGAGQGHVYLMGAADTALPITQWSPQEIQAVIPAEIAAGRYRVTVENRMNDKNDRDTVVKFAVDSLAPASATAGTVITLAGRNFGPTQGLATLTVGEHFALIDSWASQSITFRVPAGVSTGLHSVTLRIAGQSDSSRVLAFTAPPPPIGPPVTMTTGAPIPAVISVAESPVTATVVRFVLRDQFGRPVTGSHSVAFSWAKTLSGAIFQPATTETTLGAADVRVYAGTMAGTLRIAANATELGIAQISTPVTVTGDVPSADRFSVSASPLRFSGFLSTAVTTTILVHAADR